MQRKPRSKIFVAAVLLIALSLAQTTNAASLAQSSFLSNIWSGWAGVAWRYWNNCWNPSTGLTFDSCNWHYFTLWGLGSNIIGLVSAYKLGLVSDYTSRVDKILSFLNSMSLNNNVPYDIYSSDTGTPASSSPTSAADLGRLLLSLYLLKQQLTQLGYTNRLSQVTSAVKRIDTSSYGFGVDIYGYYASLGFMLWGFQATQTAFTQSGFQNLVKNGPFVASSKMYGVTGIPTNTRIDGEPFINAVLELGQVAQVTSLSSWSSLLQLGRSVYSVQEKRSASTGKPEFWTGGGLDFSPGFISQWIVWTTGATWVVLDNNGNTFTNSKVPVAYAKLMFAYNALYNTAYTTTMLNTYATNLETSNGFMEGIYATGAIDTNVQIETNQIILSSAVADPTTTTTSTSLVTTTTYNPSPISSISLGASTNSVYFVLPDYTGPYHTSAAKCGGVITAQLSDYSAGGFAIGSYTNPQNLVLDTSSSVSQTTCGNPTGIAGTIVAIAGPIVNEAVHYYEQVLGVTPIYFLSGASSKFVVRSTGQKFAVSVGNPMPGDDLFVIEGFVDGSGRSVYIVYGFSWQGTLAGATFFNSNIRNHLSQFTGSWYIYEWKDASSGLSANSVPDAGDSYTQLASG